MSEKEESDKTNERDENEGSTGTEPTMAETVRDRWIAIAAYYRAVQRGFVENHELDDWLEAENEYRELMAKNAGKN